MVGEGQTDDLYVRERAPAEVLLEKKRKKEKVRGRFWNVVESREAKKRKEWMRISIRVWWRKIKRKGKEKEKKETHGRKK